MKEQEHENCKGTGLTTRVAEHLWELIGKIETVSDNLEDVLDLLLTWKARMAKCEEQSLYN